MSEIISQQFNRCVDSVREYTRENPYTAAAVFAGSSVLVATVVAFWRLKPSEHPNTISVDLPMHPLFGHVPAMASYVKSKRWHDKMIEMLTNERAKRAGIVTLCMPKLVYSHLHFIIDPELVKYLFIDQSAPRDRVATECFREIVGNSIFGSFGSEWRDHRKIATPMFSQQNLQGFMFDCSQAGAQRAVDMLKSRMIEDESGKISTTVDMFDVLGRFTMDVIVEILFGKKSDSIEAYPEEYEFGQAFDRAFSHSSNRMRDPLWKVKKYLQIGVERQMTEHVNQMYDFVNGMLDLEGRKRMIIDETGIDKHDIISLYLSNNSELSESDLRSIALSFIFAGRDTTRNLLAWCLALMCTSEKEWMERVMAEIRGIDSKDPSYEDINKRLRLTECVLLETLRLYPSVIATSRALDRDITLPSGATLFQGCRILCVHIAQARNTEIYGEDAAEFNPMRWWDKGINTFPSHVFGAFNFEPKVCLGRKFALMQAKNFLFYFLRELKHQSIGDVFPSFPTSALLIMEDGWDVEVSLRK